MRPSRPSQPLGYVAECEFAGCMLASGYTALTGCDGPDCENVFHAACCAEWLVLNDRAIPASNGLNLCPGCLEEIAVPDIPIKKEAAADIVSTQEKLRQPVPDVIDCELMEDDAELAEELRNGRTDETLSSHQQALLERAPPDAMFEGGGLHLGTYGKRGDYYAVTFMRCDGYWKLRRAGKPDRLIMDGSFTSLIDWCNAETADGYTFFVVPKQCVACIPPRCF